MAADIGRPEPRRGRSTSPPALSRSQLTRVTRICLALPESERQDRGHHIAFNVRGKRFAYYLDDHHGDGIVAICCRAKPAIHGLLLRSDPTRFYRPAYIAHKGWVGYRLDRGEVDWSAVSALIVDSYRLAAPKRLAATVAGVSD